MAKLDPVKEPLVSVCIPAYNCGKYILETLSCLSAQTYQNLEVIVVNDGSTDNTEMLAKSIYDKRIKIFTVENGFAMSYITRLSRAAILYGKNFYAFIVNTFSEHFSVIR